MKYIFILHDNFYLNIRFQNRTNSLQRISLFQSIFQIYILYFGGINTYEVLTNSSTNILFPQIYRIKSNM